MEAGTDLTAFEKWLPSSRVFLTCPYKDKEAAKQLGAQWDPASKTWYVPGWIDPRPFAKWSA